MKFVYQIIIVFILSFTSLCSFGATVSDDLSKILPKEILKQQVKTGKTILVYCYTSWCKPCMKMSKDVFNHKDVKTYMKESILFHQVDMESDEGVALSKMYNITTYPTFLLIQGGVVTTRFIGAYEPDVFLKKLKERTLVKLEPCVKDEV